MFIPHHHFYEFPSILFYPLYSFSFSPPIFTICEYFVLHFLRLIDVVSLMMDLVIK